MRFKKEILKSLQRNPNHQDLLSIIGRHKAAGKGQKETYDELQDIWLCFGFDDDRHDEANPLRDNLEYVMELVWGFCPQGRAVWGKSLSNKDFEEIES